MQIRVPNIGADRFDPAAVKDVKWANTLRLLGVGTDQPKAARIEVDKSDQVLRVLDGEGKLLAQFTATMGSSQFPLPLGTWKIQGIGYNPPWQYDPALLATADKSDPKLESRPAPTVRSEWCGSTSARNITASTARTSPIALAVRNPTAAFA